MRNPSNLAFVNCGKRASQGDPGSAHTRYDLRSEPRPTGHLGPRVGCNRKAARYRFSSAFVCGTVGGEAQHLPVDGIEHVAFQERVPEQRVPTREENP
jgi:hypothetical protein